MELKPLDYDPDLLAQRYHENEKVIALAEKAIAMDRRVLKELKGLEGQTAHLRRRLQALEASLEGNQI